jgi:hypothetical protein
MGLKDLAGSSDSVWRLSKIVLLSWLSMLGIDFFLNGGLLAGLYLEASPALLSPSEAFRLIPLGYLSIFLFAVLLVWVTARLNVKGWQNGLIYGSKIGLLVGGSSFLGLLSISSLNIVLLLGLFIGQWLEFSVAGAVAGSGVAAASLARLSVKVAAIVLILFLLTVVLQSLGLVQAVTL